MFHSIKKRWNETRGMNIFWSHKPLLLLLTPKAKKPKRIRSASSEDEDFNTHQHHHKQHHWYDIHMHLLQMLTPQQPRLLQHQKRFSTWRKRQFHLTWKLYAVMNKFATGQVRQRSWVHIFFIVSLVVLKTMFCQKNFLFSFLLLENMEGFSFCRKFENSSFFRFRKWKI